MVGTIVLRKNEDMCAKELPITLLQHKFRAIMQKVKKPKKQSSSRLSIVASMSSVSVSGTTPETSLAIIPPPLFADCFWDYMPDEVIVHILHYLGQSCLLNIAPLISRRFQLLSTRDDLWLGIYLRKMPHHMKLSIAVLRPILGNPATGTWHTVVSNRLNTEKNWKKGKWTETTLEGHTDWIWTLQFKDKMLITGSDDRTIKIWDMERGKSTTTYRGHKEGVRCLQFDVDRGIIVSGSQDKQLLLWRMPNQRNSLNVKASRGSIHVSSSLNASVRGVAVEERESEFYMPKASFQGHEGTVTCMQFKDNTLISGSVDNMIKLWDLETTKLMGTLSGHTDRVRCLQLDQKVLVSGSGDNTVRIWDMRMANAAARGSSQCVSTLRGHTCTVVSLQCEGNRLVTGSSDTTIGVWDLRASAKMIKQYKEHTNYVLAVQFHHNRLISGSGDKTVKIWDMHQDTALHTLRFHQRLVSCLQFDDRRIVTGSFDRTVHVWDFHVK